MHLDGPLLGLEPDLDLLVGVGHLEPRLRRRLDRDHRLVVQGPAHAQTGSRGVERVVTAPRDVRRVLFNTLRVRHSCDWSECWNQ